MYLHATEYQFKHIYDMKTLKDYCDYAERDIKRAEEVILKIRKYQQELFEHVQSVVNTSTKHVVHLDRREDYSTKKKTYSVSVEVRPVVDAAHVDGRPIYGTFSEQQKFIGTERNQAIKYAESLAKKYRCEIERAGRWK